MIPTPGTGPRLMDEYFIEQAHLPRVAGGLGK
jgi:hypothetical protein